MINISETGRILEQMFGECYEFWIRQGKEELDAFKMAIRDIECMKRDPYSPNGDFLDKETKKQFIHYKQMDLGGK